MGLESLHCQTSTYFSSHSHAFSMHGGAPYTRMECLRGVYDIWAPGSGIPLQPSIVMTPQGRSQRSALGAVASVDRYEIPAETSVYVLSKVD